MAIPRWAELLIFGSGDVAASLAGGFIGHKLSEGKLSAKIGELAQKLQEHYQIERKQVMTELVLLGPNGELIIRLLSSALQLGSILVNGHARTEHWIIKQLLEVEPSRRVEVYTYLNGKIAEEDMDAFFTVLEGYYNDGMWQQLQVVMDLLRDKAPEWHAFFLGIGNTPAFQAMNVRSAALENEAGASRLRRELRRHSPWGRLKRRIGRVLEIIFL